MLSKNWFYLTKGGISKLEHDLILATPVLWGKHFGNPKYAWAFPTVPQKHTNNRVHIWPRGKTLGGSSAINFSVNGSLPLSVKSLI